MEVAFSSRAKKHLEDLLDYLEIEWFLKVKHNFIAKLDQGLANISQFPESFPGTPQRKGLYKCVISKQTILYYRIKSKEIEVVALFDSRRDSNTLNL